LKVSMLIRENKLKVFPLHVDKLTTTTILQKLTPNYTHIFFETKIPIPIFLYYLSMSLVKNYPPLTINRSFCPKFCFTYFSMRFCLSQTRIESQVHLVDFGRRFSHNVLLLQKVLKK
jgi:hypothetical protein